MNTTFNWIWSAVALILGLGIGYLIGITKNTSPKNPVVKKEIAKDSTPSTISKQVVKDSIANSPVAQDDNKEEVKSTTPVAPLPTPETLPVKSSKDSLGKVKICLSDNKMSEILTSVSEHLEAQKLAYIISEGQDCSGIFHKIKDSIRQRLILLCGSNDYVYPMYKKERSSRQVADWFWEKGNLIIVEDPMKSRNSIRPGCVMFFGKPGKKFQNMTIEQLTDKNNNYTSNGYIMHVGVVTEVKTDKNNNVIEYTMMHGRNSRIHASRTNYHTEFQSKNRKDLPKFGNWSQQWVAMAYIITPS